MRGCSSRGCGLHVACALFRAMGSNSPFPTRSCCPGRSTASLPARADSGLWFGQFGSIQFWPIHFLSGLHTQPQNSKRAHLSAPALKHHQNSTKEPTREKRTKKLRRERENKERNFGRSSGGGPGKGGPGEGHVPLRPIPRGNSTQANSTLARCDSGQIFVLFRFRPTFFKSKLAQAERGRFGCFQVFPGFFRCVSGCVSGVFKCVGRAVPGRAVPGAPNMTKPKP